MMRARLHDHDAQVAAEQQRRVGFGRGAHQLRALHAALAHAARDQVPCVVRAVGGAVAARRGRRASGAGRAGGLHIGERRRRLGLPLGRSLPPGDRASKQGFREGLGYAGCRCESLSCAAAASMATMLRTSLLPWRTKHSAGTDRRTRVHGHLMRAEARRGPGTGSMAGCVTCGLSRSASAPLLRGRGIRAAPGTRPRPASPSSSGISKCAVSTCGGAARPCARAAGAQAALGAW